MYSNIELFSNELIYDKRIHSIEYKKLLLKNIINIHKYIELNCNNMKIENIDKRTYKNNNGILKFDIFGVKFCSLVYLFSLGSSSLEFFIHILCSIFRL